MDFLSEFESKLPDLNPREKALNRGDFLIRPGEIEKYAYLIREGTLRIFYVSEHEEFTIRFGYSGEFITALPSFFSGNENELFIQALKKTSLIAISKEKFEAWLHSTPELQQFYIQWLKQLVLQQQEREIDLLTSSPSERFRRVYERSNRVFQEIPLKYIANYLRMTPETFSRLKKS